MGSDGPTGRADMALWRTYSSPSTLRLRFTFGSCVAGVTAAVVAVVGVVVAAAIVGGVVVAVVVGGVVALAVADVAVFVLAGAAAAGAAGIGGSRRCSGRWWVCKNLSSCTIVM